ncbi:MAG TPA: universal stress protein, partial [Legionellaceae bacterium]|nr:universal stress protein [Legionellaceae bacterium]
LHVVEAPPTIVLAQGLGFAEIESPEPMIEDAKAVMQILGESLKIPKKYLFVELGSIKQQILKKTMELDCQLLIIGHHTFSKLSFGMGDNTRIIMDEAHCDVLTLR